MLMRNLTIEFLLTFFLPGETKVLDIYLFTGIKTPASCGGHIYNLAQETLGQDNCCKVEASLGYKVG